MSKSWTVGCLIVESVQLMDIASIDLLGMLTREYLEACEMPDPILNLSIDVKIHYITSTGVDAPLTADATMKSTADLTTPAVQPGKLDILFIPGPDPKTVPDEATKKFIRDHAAQEKTDILTVCTGILPAAHSGILKGKTATGPRAIISRLQKLSPDTNWVDKRFSHDGRLWCSGGITNGHDMVAAYLREKVPSSLAETVCAMADVGERGPDYDQSKVGMFSFFGWQIFKALIMGFGSKKQAAPKKIA